MSNTISLFIIEYLKFKGYKLIGGELIKKDIRIVFKDIYTMVIYRKDKFVTRQVIDHSDNIVVFKFIEFINEMENSKFTTINICIEKHNDEDSYYKEYIDKTFYTTSNISPEDIHNILEDIKPKELENKDSYYNYIDKDHLYNKLKENDIHPLIIDIDHTYYLQDED